MKTWNSFKIKTKLLLLRRIPLNPIDELFQHYSVSNVWEMSPLYNQSKILIICFDVSFTPKRHKYGIKDSSRMIKKHTKSCRWTCIRKTPIRTLKWTFIYEIHTNGITVLGDERSSDFIRAHSEWPGMSKWDPPPTSLDMSHLIFSSEENINYSFLFMHIEWSI